jgi:hypothetical protein
VASALPQASGLDFLRPLFDTDVQRGGAVMVQSGLCHLNQRTGVQARMLELHTTAEGPRAPLQQRFLVSGIWTSVRPLGAGHTRERLAGLSPPSPRNKWVGLFPFLTFNSACIPPAVAWAQARPVKTAFGAPAHPGVICHFLEWQIDGL